MHKQSKAIHGQIPRSQYREHSSPLFLTSSFVFQDAEHGEMLFSEQADGNIYSRFSNPNNSEFVDKMAMLEGVEDGFAFASGMAAIFSGIAAFLNSGDHIVASKALFGSSYQIITQILPRWGITHTFVDRDDPALWENAIQENTRMLFAETPSNPGLDLIDLEYLGELKKKYNLLLNVDNCFATPVLQNPAEYGADLITHSATKLIDGQGRVIGGVVVGSEEAIASVRFFARHTGPAMSPFNAWLLSKSLETLYVRVKAHCENALTLANVLENNKNVKFVKYPFLPSHPQYELAKKQMKMGGAMVSFEPKGGAERAKRFVDALEMLSLTSNLGDTRTIVTHPATTTHSKLSKSDRVQVGITEGLLRVSVGLEDVNDIVADVEQALEKSK